jgi:hypothetical protein
MATLLDSRDVRIFDYRPILLIRSVSRSVLTANRVATETRSGGRVHQKAKREEAERLARTIVGEFTVAGLNSRAITAVGYLSEAIAAKKASTQLVSDIREYVISLRTSPQRDFAAPPLTASEQA